MKSVIDCTPADIGPFISTSGVQDLFVPVISIPMPLWVLHFSINFITYVY
jgi:hypothetical protein